MYPSAERKGRGKKLAKSDEQNEPGQSTLLMYDTCAEISTMVGVKQARLTHSGMPVVAGNNCNDNKLFINDMPFLVERRSLGESLKSAIDITDDELVMNASVLIDALEGRLKLVPMPDSNPFARFVAAKTVRHRSNAPIGDGGTHDENYVCGK
ncbi:hypothetical protein OSTOST_21901, partial [Ostertagia ostertagi]